VQIDERDVSWTPDPTSAGCSQGLGGLSPSPDGEELVLFHYQPRDVERNKRKHKKIDFASEEVDSGEQALDLVYGAAPGRSETSSGVGTEW